MSERLGEYQDITTLTVVRALGGVASATEGYGKSTRSAAAGHCLKAAVLQSPTGETFVGMGDDKQPDQPPLVLPLPMWNSFLDGIRNNEFNL